MKLFLDCFNMFTDFTRHILINFACVLTSAKKLILALTWRNVCSWYTLGSLSCILSPKRANFFTQFSFDNSQFITTKNRKGHIGFQWHDPVLLLLHP
jgi:hypothetical protein